MSDSDVENEISDEENSEDEIEEAEAELGDEDIEEEAGYIDEDDGSDNEDEGNETEGYESPYLSEDDDRDEIELDENTQNLIRQSPIHTINLSNPATFFEVNPAPAPVVGAPMSTMFPGTAVVSNVPYVNPTPINNQIQAPFVSTYGQAIVQPVMVQQPYVQPAVQPVVQPTYIQQPYVQPTVQQPVQTIVQQTVQTVPSIQSQVRPGILVGADVTYNPVVQEIMPILPGGSDVNIVEKKKKGKKTTDVAAGTVDYLAAPPRGTKYTDTDLGRLLFQNPGETPTDFNLRNNATILIWRAYLQNLIPENVIILGQLLASKYNSKAMYAPEIENLIVQINSKLITAQQK